MNRHAAVAGILLCCFLSVLAQAPPSVVLITVDTLRADRLEAYGYTAAQTPVISALAKDGVLFENAIVQTPITLPSHASILTGTYPHFHGLQDVVGRLREDVPIVTEWFQGQGYDTAAFVGSSVLLSQWGLSRGFDVYEDDFKVQGIRQVDFSRVERPAGAVIDLAVAWLRQGRSKPFFLWVHLYDPHDPYAPPEPFASRFRTHPYDGEIAYVDAELGRFLQTLRELKLYDNSLIVLTADHGEGLGEHGEEHHAYYIYESSLRVPLIFKLPGSFTREPIPPGSRVGSQVRSVDIAPTVLQLIGQRPLEWMQGEGLLALMAGKRSEQHLPAYAETHYARVHFGWSPLFSFSNGRYKFIEAPLPELYDLPNDPAELHNLYAQQQSLAHQLRNELHQLQRRYAGMPGASAGGDSLDPETVERFKSLGYIAFSAGSPAEGTSRNLPDPKLKIDVYNELNAAIELSRRGRSRESIDALKKVSRAEPGMPLVHFLLGTEYLAQGMDLVAAEQFMETVRLNPDSNVARFNLARTWLRAGLIDKSEAVTRELLSREPSHFGARHHLATVLGRQGRYQEAIEQELKAIEGRPSFPEAHLNLGSYYLNLGRVEEAIASYREALRYAPGDVPTRINLALAYLKENRFDQALEMAQEVVRMSPRSSLGYLYLAQAYQGKGMGSEAEAAFAKARQLNREIQ